MGNVNKEIGLYPMSGDVVRFVSTAKLPIGGFETEWTPEQNLHGYEYPWPAGGGKNLLPNELPSHTINATISSSTDSITSATNARTFAIPCEANTDYTLSQKETGISWTIGFGDKLPEIGDAVDRRGNMTNRVAWTLNSGEHNYIIIAIASEAGFNTLVSTNEGMVEKGSDKTSYTPYENICPITGKDSVIIYVSPTPEITDETVVQEIVFPVQGYNQWDEEWVNGYINDSGTFISRNDIVGSKNPIRVNPSTSYYFSAPVTGMFVTYWDKNGTFISRYQVSSSKVFTTPSNCYYVQFNLPAAYGSSYDSDISINYPSTETGYYPYKGRTVYGGTLTINEDGSGKLTATMASVDLGTLSWSKQTTGLSHFVFRCEIPTIKLVDDSTVANILCERYRTISTNIMNSANTPNYSVSARASTIGGVRIYDTDYIDSTGSQFKTAMSRVQLVYELAEPIEYNLTVDQIKTLIGYNYVWNTGGATNITFQYYTGGEGMGITFLDCWTYPKAKLDEMFKAVTDRLDALEEAADDSDAKTTLLETKEKATEDVAEEEGDE